MRNQPAHRTPGPCASSGALRRHNPIFSWCSLSAQPVRCRYIPSTVNPAARPQTTSSPNAGPALLWPAEVPASMASRRRRCAFSRRSDRSPRAAGRLCGFTRPVMGTPDRRMTYAALAGTDPPSRLHRKRIRIDPTAILHTTGSQAPDLEQPRWSGLIEGSPHCHSRRDRQTIPASARQETGAGSAIQRPSHRRPDPLQDGITHHEHRVCHRTNRLYWRRDDAVVTRSRNRARRGVQPPA